MSRREMRVLRRDTWVPPYRTGAVNRSVGGGVPQWSEAEQVPLGYDAPSARSAALLFYFSTMTLPRFRSARPSCTRASVPAKSSVVCSPLVMSLQAITPLAISSSPRNTT